MPVWASRLCVWTCLNLKSPPFIQLDCYVTDSPFSVSLFQGGSEAALPSSLPLSCLLPSPFLQASSNCSGPASLYWDHITSTYRTLSDSLCRGGKENGDGGSCVVDYKKKRSSFHTLLVGVWVTLSLLEIFCISAVVSLHLEVTCTSVLERISYTTWK